MIHLSRLQYFCNTAPALLLAISEEEMVSKPAPGKWSKKEIVGHLLDSAHHNHYRFVKLQFEEIELKPYHQNEWVEYNHYHKLSTVHLIALWEIYNRHIIAIIECLPEQVLYRMTAGENAVTMEWLINDYIMHLEHHLKQIIHSKNYFLKK